jgi:hypothetical protein
MAIRLDRACRARSFKIEQRASLYDRTARTPHAQLLKHPHRGDVRLVHVCLHLWQGKLLEGVAQHGPGGFRRVTTTPDVRMNPIDQARRLCLKAQEAGEANQIVRIARQNQPQPIPMPCKLCQAPLDKRARLI